MCPACGELLVVVEFQGVEIDRCPACGGIWLDRGELEQILTLADLPAGSVAAALHQGASGPRSRRRCLRCRRRLCEVQIGGSGVTADRCRVGHGLWFDAGELTAVVRAFAGDRGDAVADFLADLLRFDLARQSAASGQPDRGDRTC